MIFAHCVHTVCPTGVLHLPLNGFIGQAKINRFYLCIINSTHYLRQNFSVIDDFARRFSYLQLPNCIVEAVKGQKGSLLCLGSLASSISFSPYSIVIFFRKGQKNPWVLIG